MLRRLLPLLAALACACGAASAFAAASPRVAPSAISPERFRVERDSLPNGLQILLHEDHSVPAVCFTQWYRVGSRNERQGITGLFAAKGTTQADKRKSTDLLSALGETVWVAREDLIDSVTALSGSGPAYLFLMAEAMTEAGIAEGLPREQAERLARATVAGSGALLAADKSPAAHLREAVTSPGGTTQAALTVLMADDGLKALMKRAIHAARKRAEELR